MQPSEHGSPIATGVLAGTAPSGEASRDDDQVGSSAKAGLEMTPQGIGWHFVPDLTESLSLEVPGMIGLAKQVRALDVALAERDDYTGEHCSRVESFSLQLGKRCGLGVQELQILGVAARLHDVGKVGIPDQVLLKPAKLEPEEWEVMKSHSEIGQRVCDALPHPHAEAVGRIVRHHHEWFNGGGYPDGLTGEAIPISARIISLVDAYDAMTTTRPYHRPRTHLQTMSVLDDECTTHFDPFVFRHFQTVVGARDNPPAHGA